MRGVVCDCSRNGSQGIAEGSYVLFVGMTTLEKEGMSLELQVEQVEVWREAMVWTVCVTTT